MLSIVRKSLVFAVYLLLVACANSDNEDQQDPIDQLPILSTEEIATMLDEGRFEEVANSVKRKERGGVAERADLILAARAYVLQQDPIGADVALERISLDERDQGDFVILAARVKMLEGDFEDAVEMLEDYDFEGDEFYEAKILSGDNLFLLKKPEEAIEHFSTAIEANPDYLPAYISRAQMYLNTGQLPEAEADALKAVEIEANNTITQFTLGNAYRRRGKFDEAKEAYLASLEAFPENVSALNELTSLAIFDNEIDKAKEYLDRTFAAAPEDSLARFFDAMVDVLEGNEEIAKDRLLLLAAASPSNPQINRLLGHVAYRLGDHETALERLEAVYRVAPFDRITRLALGDIYTRAGRSRRALNVLEPMIEDGSNDFVALSIASSAAAQRDDFDKAIEFTQRSVELARNPDQARNQEVVANSIDGSQIKVMNRKLATYYFESNKQDKAYEILQEIRDEDENDVTTTMLLLNLQIQGGDLDDAMQNAVALIERAPESAIGYNARGTVNFHQGNLDAAIQDYDKSLEINPEYISAYKNRGTANLRLENYQATIDDLKVVLEAAPSDAHALIMTARAHLESGSAEHANDIYLTLEDVFENSPSYQLQHARAYAALNDYVMAIKKLRLAARVTDNNNTALVAYTDDLMAEFRAAMEAQAAETADVDQRTEAQMSEREAKLQALEDELRAQNEKLKQEEAANADKDELSAAEKEAEAKRRAEADRRVEEAIAKRKAELEALEEELRKQREAEKAEEKQDDTDDDTGDGT